jgi:hypothetical protein
VAFKWLLSPFNVNYDNMYSGLITYAVQAHNLFLLMFSGIIIAFSRHHWKRSYISGIFFIFIKFMIIGEVCNVVLVEIWWFTRWRFIFEAVGEEKHLVSCYNLYTKSGKIKIKKWVCVFVFVCAHVHAFRCIILIV